MNTPDNLIGQLESMLATKDISKRAEVLRRVTDLFVYGSGKFTDKQIDFFDDVMGKLIEHIELAARAAFGSRLAKLPDAPGRIMRSLAFDDAIEVAAPVLAHSLRLDEAALAENARTKSQDHMLAIAGRSVLTEPVTDVLVQRGNNEVAVKTAKNRGAKFSHSGMSQLVKRAHDNGNLALCVWSRPDIPRAELLKLFVNASEVVRGKLEAADPRRTTLIRAAVAEASEEVQTTARVGSNEHADAAAHVRSIHAMGKLDEARLLSFARSRCFDKTAVALSLMCDLPIGPVERALVQSEPDQLLILAKAIDLSWETAKALLALHLRLEHVPKERLDRWFASFFRLQPKSARAALQFFRLQEKAKMDSVH
ncbi:DUF2336 domain-containing protein [Bradyrhizobium sp. C-145]|uniref:DUF2336 domain-containing protein n=1 Tax=Bradyrhizobium sp. C-145 TaxID=574727 RepID=UPI00201B8A96|nr:DUF2336 domain-containing protein [Bradyrhizobium sp. C-145]UQR65077.1 DUF2336 domain-containing protein [Bradyrhizobium sp. C-145]